MINPSLESLTIRFSDYTLDLIPSSDKSKVPLLKSSIKRAVQAWESKEDLQDKKIAFARSMINDLTIILAFSVYYLEAEGVDMMECVWDPYKEPLRPFLERNAKHTFFVNYSGGDWLKNVPKETICKTLSSFIVGQDFLKSNAKHLESIYA